MNNLESNEQFHNLNFPFKYAKRRKLLPGARSVLNRLLSAHQLNEVYREALSRLGEGHFVEKVLETLNINCELSRSDLARIPSSGPVVVIANHPFGAIEGMILISKLRSVRSDVKVMANFLLSRIKELRDLMIFVDPFARKGSIRANVKPLKETIRWVNDGHMLAVFPAGEVAHLDLAKREITDPQWSDNIARIVRLTGSSVLPVFFKGGNGVLFQLLGLMHPRVRTALLPHELMNKRDKNVEIRVGSLIPFRELEMFGTDADMTAYLRQRTYILSHREDARFNSESNCISSALDSYRESKTGAILPASMRRRSVTVRVKPEPIVPPQEPSMLTNEVQGLPPEQILVRNGEYIVFRADFYQIPCLMQEIGRLREISFRNVGEGTGKAIDLDKFDSHYIHLCLWNEKKSELVGAYRFGRTDEILRQRGKGGLYTSTLFDYSDSFLIQLGSALEMGRSFVRPEYQRSISPLFLLWRGIGEYVAENPQYRTLFGPVSISNDYRPISRQLMVEYLREQNYIQDFAGEVNAKNPYKLKAIKGLNLKAMGIGRGIDNLSAIIAEIEEDNKPVPVLLKQYLNLGGKILGFNVDSNFRDSLDGLIMVDLTQTGRRLLERYLGEEGAARFLAYHSPLCSTVCA